MSEQELDKELERIAHGLMEHVDSVAIFVTRRHGASGTTPSVGCRAGNYYANLAVVREWLIQEDEKVRNEMKPRPEDFA